MPRLSTKHYLNAHQRLRQLWLHQQILFSLLSPEEQWTLHQFFVPDHDLNDKELASYRKDITAKLPSLPQRAGRFYLKFEQHLEKAGVEPQGGVHERIGRIYTATPRVSQDHVLNPRRGHWDLKGARDNYKNWSRSQ